jgi:protein-tyrosine-phosphatase
LRRRIATADCDAFDMIVGMDRANPAHLRAMAPGGARAGLSPMRDHGAAQGDVPDP